MPRRSIPLVTGEIYHVFNRGIDRRITFTSYKEYFRFQQAIEYYRFNSLPIKLSRYLTLQENEQTNIKKAALKSGLKVSIIAYCLMPNHFHLLIRQESDEGISHFLSQIQNSFVRYFNTSHERLGQLFLVQFKAVRIETDEQLVHVSRYIHLNPYTSYILKTLDETFVYSWSSLPEYLGTSRKNTLNTKPIIAHFKDVQSYRQFVADQAGYQRELDKIKHLVFE